MEQTIFSNNTFSTLDKRFMSLALSEAARGLGFTSPNPMVGAVIVKDGKIISTGYHHQVGLPHAERDAINNAVVDGKTEKLYGSTMYVTLEPCCHIGRTPPCTDVIVENKIARVVVASLDPDTRVAGKGIEILRNAGIQVDIGLLDEENHKLNSIYFYNKQFNKPYIVMKAAVSLDGKIATSTGDSSWISNEQSRIIVHKLRARLKSIAIGKNTIIHDKPRLNCRLSNLLLDDKPIDKLIFSNSEENLSESFAKNNGKVFYINESLSNKSEFLKLCNDNEIDSVLVEGGAKVYSCFLKNDLVDRIILFYRPAFIGANGLNVVNFANISEIAQLQDWTIASTCQVDDNIMVDLYKKSEEQGEPLCLLDW